MTGLTRSVITNIENGRREDLTISELLAISVALTVPPVALLYRIEEPFAFVDLAGHNVQVHEAVRWIGGDVRLLDLSPAGKDAATKLAYLEQLVSHRQRLYELSYEIREKALAVGLDTDVLALQMDSGRVHSSAIGSELVDRVRDAEGIEAARVKAMLGTYDHTRDIYKVVSTALEDLGGVAGDLAPTLTMWMVADRTPPEARRDPIMDAREKLKDLQEVHKQIEDDQVLRATEGLYRNAMRRDIDG